MKTPAPVVQLLHKEDTRVVNLPDIHERLIATGHRVIAGTPQQLADNVAAAGIRLTTEEVATLDKVSELPPEYPGWMLKFQGGDRAGQD